MNDNRKPFSLSLTLSALALFFAGAAFSIGLVNFYHSPGLSGHATILPLASGDPHVELTERSSTPADRKFLAGASNLIADVAEDIAPSVVNIDIQKTNRNQMPMNDEFFQRFFGLQPMSPFHMQQQSPIMRGNGSGVIISEDGDVLTNNHVVNGADEITVTTKDGKKYNAKVIGRDTFSDVAVLKMEGASHLKPAKLGTSAHLRPGEWVIAVGSPLGFDHTVTLGIVSALSRQVPDINANVEFIQTDAAINPGNSGGPLVNLDGEVIGINTAIAGSGQNIGFAIPVDIVKKVAEDLIQTGHITRPWIGISMAELNPDLAKSIGVPGNVTGVIVAQVLPDSPSSRAGFQQGDIIQRINGTQVKTPKEIQDLVRSKPVNAEFNIQILRNGQMNAITLRTEALPDKDANPSQPTQEEN
jgi:serine protease Do